jgi:hypothetical protein
MINHLLCLVKFEAVWINLWGCSPAYCIYLNLFDMAKIRKARWTCVLRAFDIRWRRVFGFSTSQLPIGLRLLLEDVDYKTRPPKKNLDFALWRNISLSRSPKQIRLCCASNDPNMIGMLLLLVFLNCLQPFWELLVFS